MLEHQESPSPLTPSQVVAKARLEQIREWDKQWGRLKQVPEFKKLILEAYLGDLPEQEQRVLSLLDVYGEDATEFKEGKLEWLVKKGLQKHFDFLERQGPRAKEVLDKFDAQQTDQGKEEDDDFSELR